MCTMTLPEIDGKTEFRAGDTIRITMTLPNGMELKNRLQNDDPRIDIYNQYVDTLRPEYQFSKFYVSGQKTTIIVERVFNIKETNTIFSLTDMRFGMFHLYKRNTSKFLDVKKSENDLGIYYNSENGNVIVYSAEDTRASLNNVNYILTNMEKFVKYMEQLKAIYDMENMLFNDTIEEPGEKWRFRQNKNVIRSISNYYEVTQNSSLLILNS